MHTSSPCSRRRRSAVESLAVGAVLTLAVLLGVPGVAQAQEDNQITVWLERESSSVHEGEADGFGIYLSAPPNTLPNSDDDDFTDASGQFKIPLVATPFGGARRGIDFHGPGVARFWLNETRTGLGVWAHEDDRVEEGHGVDVTFGTLPMGVILAVGKPTTMRIDFIDGPSGPRVSFDLDPATISENGGTSTISASMNKTADEDVTLTVAADPLEPAVAGDFTLSTNRTLTIPAGSQQSTGLVTLTAEDNDLDGPSKVILIKGVLSEGTTGVGAPNPGRLVITDDEVESTSIALSVDPTAVSEGAGTTSVTVTGTLNGLPRDTETEVNVSVAGVTATAEGTDFATVDAFTLTIPANSRSGTATFDLTPTDDTSQEVAETISVSGTNDNGLTVSAATLNITDNDAPQYTLTVNPTTIDEADGTTTVTASTGGTTFLEDQTIALSFGGTATKGTDYSVDAESLTLTAGRSSVSTTVRAVDDPLTDPNETIEITATLNGGQLGTKQTVTITDDETASTRITLTLAPAEVAEDAGETNVTVTGELDGGALSTATDVTVTVAGGTATAGTDFATVDAFTLTIAANETSGEATFRFTPTDDTTEEETETVEVSGATTVGGLTVSAATLNITNDDEPRYALSVSVTAIAEVDGTSTVTVSTGGVSFLEDQTIALEFGGTATKESDYSVDAESLRLTAGETSVSTTVRAVDDTMTDPDETIEIVAKLDRQQIGDTRTVTIADDETAATRITLSVNPAAVAEDAGATDITVTGTLNGAAQSTAVEIEVSVASGTATADTDFTAVTSFALKIDANETTGTATFRFTPTNDSLAEETETVKVTGNAVGDLTVWATSLDITDDDAPRYTLAVNPASIAESEGTASVTVSTGGVTFSDDQTFTLSFAGSATKGTDYSVEAESLTLTAGQTSVSTTVRTVDDDDDDPNETIEITAALNGVTVGTTQTLTITDDDGTRSGSETVEDDTASTQISLSVAPAAVAEDAGATNVTVTGRLDGAALSTATSVTVSVVSGTATAGTDFVAVASFPLTIAANETSGTATFNLTPTDDSLVEDVETVKVSGSTGGDLTVLAATLEITDDDQPSYVLAVNPATIAEAGGLSTVTVSTGGVSFPADQTIALGFGGSATKGTDYSVDAESLTLTTGQTSVSTTVHAVDDTVTDPDETIEITATLNGEQIGATQTVTITDETPRKQPNRPPTAVDDQASTAEDTPVLIDVVANDTDPDGDALRVVAVMAPAHGTTTVVAGGLRYVPAPDYNGPDRFTYRVADSDGETAAAAVTVAVVPVNDAPVAVGSIPNQRLEEGGPPATLEVAPYFEDADDAVLTYTAASSDPSVTTVTVTGSELTLAAVVTGNAAVTVTAADAGGLTATQTFDVAVGDALVKDVMTDTLAALGRGYLSSVQMTLERRMEARTAQPRAMVAGQPLPLGTADLEATPSGMMQRWQMATLAAQQRGATSPAARAAAAAVRHAADQAFGSGLGPSRGGGELLQGTELLLSFGEESPAPAGGRRWTVWGQGDIQTFQGGPIGQANYDGWLRTAYLGLDAQLSRNWLAGVAVARSGGTGDWQTGPAEGRLTTALTAVHPYVRWGDQDTSVWAMMGIGRGTAANVRAADDRRETSSLALGLGLIEARRRLGEIGGGVQLGLRSEASWARLATGAGYESLDALRASVFRGRIGMEATRDTRLGSVTLTPFGALSARQDGGAGQTGTGLELAGGLRLRGGRVRLIAQGRMLALHSAAGYQERGASLTASIGAGPQQRGFALSVTPRWGASASGADTLWQDQFYRYTDGSAPFDQGIDARGSYGLGVADDRLLLVPFAAYGRIADGERLQLGTTLGALRARGGAPVEFEFSGERYTRRLRGTDHRFSLLGIVTFGGRGGGASCGVLAGCGLSGLDLPVTGTAGAPKSAGADETR